ncbi:hypothetical protein HSBAA_20140 [Vreelandella sulfidaeris]|uniref:YqgF/RNase H-like domain-containing protein n=1 Tax=Vreelandella sulfidaeris TaxID=115553 RepID=A0A455U8X4_9GAMM|nr:hypothetical protein HSBAA_20140 [Halomonas sulfidaeris]
MTLAIDPGQRTGCKVAVIDATGQFVGHTTIYPHAPQNQWNEALSVLAKLVKQHGVELIAVGNGTASRETDKLVGELLKALAPAHRLSKVMVSEAGASVYSASEYASRKCPIWMSPCAVPSRLVVVCKILSPSWLKSSPSRLV